MRGVVVVRGGGDLATGTILRLYQCGVRVLVLECAQPTAIRRAVAFCEAVYDGVTQVEGVTCRRIDTPEQAKAVWVEGEIPLLVDETGACLAQVRPVALVDAILAKRNLGTTRDMAPITVALGPGFVAGEDVDAVVETMRGHRLGRVLYTGAAQPNTGVPGKIGGYDKERVIHAPADGGLVPCTAIGDVVQAGQTLAMLGDVPVPATIDGVLRGLIRAGYPVTKGLKIADIDPRLGERENCTTVSDKARAIAGGVLEALLHLAQERGLTRCLLGEG